MNTVAAQRHIRLATEHDIGAMHAIRLRVRENRLANPEKVQPQDYEARVRAGSAWVCVVGDSVVGFAAADADTAMVWALFVDPDWERGGVGRALHARMVSWLFDSGAEQISLTTDPDTRAERFYRGAGWERAGPAPGGEVRYTLNRERFTAR